MASAAELLILLKMKNETAAAAAEVKQSMGGIKGAMVDVGKVAGGFLAANVIGAGVGFLKGQIGSIIGEAQEARQNLKQTQAVIESTGGAAGMTATQVAALADKLSLATNFTDDEVQSAENLLLTFTSIGKDVFPAATETVLNMSQALGQDLKSSAIQLGKAMNDPITGASALRRVGVALTAQQMEQIKTFQESGDIMSAQKIIMKELATEFGGSARATVDPLKQARKAVGELKEGVGLLIYPLIGLLAGGLATQVVPWLMAGTQHLGDFMALIKAAVDGDLAQAAALFATLPAPLQQLALWLAKNRDTIEEVMHVAKQLGQDVLAGWLTIFKALAPQLQAFGEFLAEHKPLALALAVALGVLVAVLIGIPALIVAVVVAAGLLAAHWDDIKAKTIEVWGAIADFMNEKLGFIVLLATYVFEDIKNKVTTAILVVRDVIKIVMALIHGDWGAAWDGVKQLLSDVWNGVVTDLLLKLQLLRDVVLYALRGLANLFGMLGGWILDALGDLGSILFDAGKEIMTGLWDGLKSKWEDVKDWFGGLGGAIKGLKGPIEKDRLLLVPEARAIMQGFRSGLVEGWGGVAPVLRGMTAGIPVAVAGGTPAAASGEMGARANVYHVYIQNWISTGDADAGLAALGAQM